MPSQPNEPALEDLKNGAMILDGLLEDVVEPPHIYVTCRITDIRAARARLEAAIRKLEEPRGSLGTFTHGMNRDCPQVIKGTWTRCLGHGKYVLNAGGMR